MINIKKWPSRPSKTKLKVTNINISLISIAEYLLQNNKQNSLTIKK